MSDNEGTKGKVATGWTDRERLVYLVSLLEHSEAKLNFKTAPRPTGRSEIACQRMVDRLKNTLKTDLEALKAGQPLPAQSDATAKTTPKKAGTPRKRKGKGDSAEMDGGGDDEVGGSPKKRGRKKEADVAEAEGGAEEV